MLWGPVGAMLGAAVLTALFSLIAWRRTARIPQSNGLAELFGPGMLEEMTADPALRNVGPRQYRRATRDLRQAVTGKDGQAHRNAIPVTKGTERDRQILLEARRHLAREGLIVVGQGVPARAHERNSGDQPIPGLSPRTA